MRHIYSLNGFRIKFHLKIELKIVGQLMNWFDIMDITKQDGTHAGDESHDRNGERELHGQYHESQSNDIMWFVGHCTLIYKMSASELWGEGESEVIEHHVKHIR